MQTVVDRSALHFRYNENAPRGHRGHHGSDRKCRFGDLCRFLAMFGPSKTIMLKIDSLLMRREVADF
jgi:sterol desaturase/sphingolipid hydroxylase (fatty acid hydroxylase superfamily)